MRKLETALFISAILLLSLVSNASSLSCGQPEDWQERVRQDAFSEIGKGFWPDEADCFHRDSTKNLGIRRRVVQIHFSTTRYNRELFCGQDFYIPFGAQCFEEPQIQTSSFELWNEYDLNEYLLQWVERGEANSYCEETNLKEQLLAQVMGAAERDQSVKIEEYILYTHHVPPLSFCDADLTSEFKKAVAELPASMSTPEENRAYYEFVRSFGTYVVNELVLGGKVM